MSTATLVGTPDREPSRRSTITHAVTTNAASGAAATVTVPVVSTGVIERAAATAITKQLLADERDPAKLREYATALLVLAERAERRVERAEKDAANWEDAAQSAGRDADDAMFRQSLVDRAGDLAHAGHDRFPWRMCREEVCKLLQEATGRSTSTH